MAGRMLMLTLILSIVSSYGSAQCCSAGNPFFYGEQSNIGHKDLQVISGYKYSLSKQYYHENEKVEIDFIDKAYFNYLNLQLIYGFSRKLSFHSDLGYFLNRTELYSKDDWEPVNGFGVGDAGLSIKYLVYKSHVRKLSIVPSIGVKVPIGVFDQEVDHVKLPITVQPSSGSFKYLLNLFMSKSFDNQKINLSSYISAEFPQLIDSDNFYYQYGNMYLFSLIGSVFVNKNLTIGIELRNENRNRASRENDQVVESSGYYIVYAVPHIRYIFTEKLYFAVNADIPVNKYYNGIQLGSEYSVSARISYRINFDKAILNEVEINKT